jgi:hypothetical protein
VNRIECSIAVSSAVPSAMAASTTCPCPVERACSSALTTPSASSIPPPPKSPNMFSGATGGPPPGAAVGSSAPARLM